MNKIIINTAIISLTLGIVFTVSGLFIYKVIKMQAQLDQNTAVLKQVTDYLNAQIQELKDGGIEEIA